MATRNGTTKTVQCDDATETEVWGTQPTSGYSLAQNGDTIVVPATSAPVTWTGTKTVNKAVTLQGAGIGNTIVVLALSGNSAIICNNVSTGGLARITGFTFRYGSGASGDINNGVFHANGSNRSGWQFRFDHNQCENLTQFPLKMDTVLGVVDHNIFLGCDGIAYTFCTTWSEVTPEQSRVQGDGSWADDTKAADVNGAVYYEDNYCESIQATCWDGTVGGRLVIRHNTIKMADSASSNKPVTTCHGSENRRRAIRLTELYNNLVTSIWNQAVGRPRGGIFIAYNNRVTANSGSAASWFSWQTDREADSVFWGRSTGASAWDLNDLTGTVANNTAGWPGFHPHTYAGNNGDPKPFFVGIAAAGTGSNTIVLPGTGYPDFTGYEATDEDLFDQAQNTSGKVFTETQYRGSRIDSQSVVGGNTQLTLAGAQYPPNTGPIIYAAGDHIRINRPVQVWDQLGIGKTTLVPLISGPLPALPAGWASTGNTQALEGCYVWNNLKRNTPSGSYTIPINWNVASSWVKTGIHVFNDVTPTGSPSAFPASPGANAVSMPYRWTAGTGGTAAEQRCGAFGLGAPYDAMVVTLDGSETNGGVGGAPYPHPLTTATSAPGFSTSSSASLTGGQAGSFSVSATGNPTPSITSSGFTSSPAGLTPLPTYTSGGAGSGTGTIAIGATVPNGIYTTSLTASNGIGAPAVQNPFTLTVSTPNQPPTVTLDQPSGPLTLTAPATISLSATAFDSDTGQTISKVEFYQGGGILIGLGTGTGAGGAGPTYTFSWTGVGQGVYVVTAKAYDSFTPAASAISSPGVTVTVNAAPALPPPTIVVTG